MRSSHRSPVAPMCMALTRNLGPITLTVTLSRYLTQVGSFIWRLRCTAQSGPSGGAPGAGARVKVRVRVTGRVHHTWGGGMGHACALHVSGSGLPVGAHQRRTLRMGPLSCALLTLGCSSITVCITSITACIVLSFFRHSVYRTVTCVGIMLILYGQGCRASYC